MSRIELITNIKSSVDIVFDLARSIDLHIDSTTGTNEKAIGGKLSGLMALGDTVTWRARHLGVYQKLTVELVEFDRPKLFVDVMLKGAFKSMRHSHHFEMKGEVTVMTDVFDFESPFGILGRVFNQIYLKAYLIKFLEKKNKILKEVAEEKQRNE